jgi:hypothetical protein
MTAAIADIKQSTDYTLETITLIDANNKEVLELKNYLVELNYYEDIFNNSVSGRISISDAVGNIDAMQGYEKVRFSFTRALGGDPITGTFFVFSISDRCFDKSNNFETYVINFCDEDLIMSERYRVCKSYKKSSISSIISDILKNFLKTPNNIDIENTIGLYDFVLPNKKIYETINWLATYALPDNGAPGADMLFFQNYNGYKFKSLQTLYQQSPIDEYFYSAKNTTSLSGEGFIDFFTIFKLEILSNMDTLNGVMKGTYYNRIISFDPLTRKYYSPTLNTNQNKDFDYDEYYNQSKKLNDDKIINVPDDTDGIYKDRFGKKLNDPVPSNFEAGPLRLMLSNSTQLNQEYLKQNNKPGALTNDIFVEKYIPNRIAQLELSSYTKIKIMVPGNSNLIAGKVVKINILNTEVDSNNDEKDNDRILSGNYLITAVRHIINLTRYITVVELSKDTRISEKSAGPWK